jgi:predicted PurR-regulated permease PerM
MASPSRNETRAFGVLFAVAAFFFLWTVSPIWVPCFLGLLLAVVASPLQKRLERRFGGHPRLLAATITAVTMALGVGLLVGVGILVVREVIRALGELGPGVASRGLAWLHSPRLHTLLKRAGSSPELLQDELAQDARVLATHLTTLLGSLLSVTSHGLLTLVFTAITSYYLLVEGRTLGGLVVRLLPLPVEQTRLLISEFHVAAVGTVLGVGVIALGQGLLATAGFALFGVDRPLVWGALTAVASLLPAVGTALVCAPVAVVHMLSGHVAGGIGLLVWWAVLVIGLCDYVLRPRLMEGRMRMHSLLVLWALFGGLEAFGPVGIILGPLFAALFVALVRMYERSYRPGASSLAPTTTKPATPPSEHGLQPQGP